MMLKSFCKAPEKVSSTLTYATWTDVLLLCHTPPSGLQKTVTGNFVLVSHAHEWTN